MQQTCDLCDSPKGEVTSDPEGRLCESCAADMREYDEGMEEFEAILAAHVQAGVLAALAEWRGKWAGRRAFDAESIGYELAQPGSQVVYELIKNHVAAPSLTLGTAAD